MLQVGQKLWYVPHRHHRRGEPYEVEVTKVGRKWATVGEGWRQERIDLETMQADGKGYSSPGTCYLSREHYETEQERLAAWSQLTKALQYSRCPAGVTTEGIKQAMQLLKVSP